MRPLGGFDFSHEDIIVDDKCFRFLHFLLKQRKLILCQFELFVIQQSVKFVHLLCFDLLYYDIPSQDMVLLKVININ